jgi:EmrB/QacA subfamily drug resistance transporter
VSLAEAGSKSPAVGAAASPAAGPAAGAAEGEGAPRATVDVRQRWLLAVCCAAQFMVILDLSIVNVALPSIQSSLGFSTTQLQWVVDAYAIFFAGFLMIGGRAADYVGQRRTFVVALLLFSLTSLGGGLSVDHQMLVVARALQGVSAALMAATSLAIITSSFAAGPARHRAIGLWGAMNGAGGAAGTLLGGVITQELSWRWVLLINPPIGIAAAAVAYRVVAERRRDGAAPRFDLAGALTLTLGQLVLIYGVVTAAVHGWTSPDALVPIVAGAGLLVLFGVIEMRFTSSPLVPLREITGSLKLANIIVLLFSAALFPMWYVSSLYLQQVLGLSPLATGFAFLPMALVIMLCASRAGKLVSRFGVRAVLGSGLVIMASGLLLFARIGSSGSALTYVVLPGILTAAGIGLSIVPSTIFATQGAGPAQAGLASGLVNTSRQAGGGLGLALLISLATGYTSGAIGRNVGVPLALTDGFRLAYLIGAGFVVAAAIVTLVFVHPSGAAVPAVPRWRLAGCVVLVLACFAAIDFGSVRPGAPIGAYTTNGAYSFVSAPGLHPPQLKAQTPTTTAQLAPGYIMMANFYDLTTSPMVGQSGPLIVNSQLQPVWFEPVPKDVVASNLTAQTYKGEPVLTWWQGVVSDTGATESGKDIIVNQHYQAIATLQGQDGWVITLHELLISGGDAWVTANKDIPMDLSKYGGPANGVLDDSAVQEYDIATGKLLYTWDALDHIPLSDSETQPPPNGFPWDAYHVNSIDLTGGSKFLVSMRNTWAAYMVDATTGSIQWQLGGKHSTFELPSDVSFEWQHDVRLNPGSIVTMFDDNCCQITGAGTYLAPAGPSRALELKLNAASGKVTLVKEYEHSNGFAAAYMGDAQLLPNGNVFVGWGSQPYFSEYSSSGQLLMDASLPSPDLTYRATVNSWVGLPSHPPSGAARDGSSGTAVYASWNGATEVTSWKILAGTNSRSLSVVATTPKTGFETNVNVKGHPSVFEVEAVNSKGQVIGTSKPFTNSQSNDQ